MGRKKSEEELAIEAELKAAKKTQKQLRAEAAAAKKAAKQEAKKQQRDAGAQSAASAAAQPAVSDADGDASASGAGAVTAAPNAADSVATSADEPASAKAGASRRLKRIAPIAAVAVVVVALVAFGIYKIAFSMSTDAWDGSSDTSWFNEEEYGKTQDGVVVGHDLTITQAEQLAGLRKLCNEGYGFEGWTFTLGRNLDMGDIESKPIGDGRNEQGQYNRFAGSFDGAGHTISGLNIVEDTWDHAGLFGSFVGPELKDLTVEGKVTGQVRVGGVAGEVMGSMVSNLTNRCTVSSLKTATAYYPVTVDCGGVLGIYLSITNQRESATITNLTNEGEVSARACSAGGVAGTIAGTEGFVLDVSKLVNNGKVTVFCESDERDEAVGGVVGMLGQYGKNTYSDFTNNGEVSCSTVCNVGGVVGCVEGQEFTMKGLKNTARVAANAQLEIACVGGIFGDLEYEDIELENLENTGEVAATNGNAFDLYASGRMEAWDKWDDEHPETY